MASTTLPGVLLTGTHAARPAASAVANGALYAETDTGQTYQSDGSATWTAWGAAATSGIGADLLPWHFSYLPTVLTPDATTGTWAQSIPGDVSSPVSGMLANASSNAQNDAVTWNIVLAAGTWDFSAYVRESTNTAIITLNFDGVSKGTADTYAGAATYAKVSITGIVVAATAKIAVQLKAATRNASNTTGWVLGIFAFEFRRTA